jgi:hypothetical protein
MKSEKFKFIKHEIGIMLVLLGIPISSVLNEYTKGQYEITNFVLLISLLLITNFQKIFSLSITITRRNAVILLFQFYIILIQIIAKQDLFTQASGMIYNIYIIFIIFAVSSSGKIEKSSEFIKLVWITTGVFNCLTSYLITNGLETFYIRGGTLLEYGADRLTLSNLGFFFVISSLIVDFRKNKLINALKVIFWISTIYNLLFFNRRSNTIYCLIIILLHFFCYNRKTVKINVIKPLVWIFFVSITILIIILIIPNVVERISDVSNSILSAIKSFLGIEKTDVSGNIRYMLRTNVVNLLLENTSFEQWIFGRGYMFKYLDFPFLQAIVDMGLIFGFIYICIQTIFPFNSWKSKNNDPAFKFFQYCSMLFFFSNFSAGIPYGYDKFAQLILLFM